MAKRIYDPERRLQTLQEASKTTGLSVYALRKGAKEGTIPSLRMGKLYFIDVPGLLQSTGGLQ